MKAKSQESDNISDNAEAEELPGCCWKAEMDYQYSRVFGVCQELRSSCGRKWTFGRLPQELLNI